MVQDGTFLADFTSLINSGCSAPMDQNRIVYNHTIPTFSISEQLIFIIILYDWYACDEPNPIAKKLMRRNTESDSCYHSVCFYISINRLLFETENFYGHWLPCSQTQASWIKNNGIICHSSLFSPSTIRLRKASEVKLRKKVRISFSHWSNISDEKESNAQNLCSSFFFVLCNVASKYILIGLVYFSKSALNQQRNRVKFGCAAH